MDEASIFLEALQKPASVDRAAYLDGACAGDAELRRSVEMLLKAHAKAGEFLNKAPADVGPTIDQPLAERPGTVIGPYKLLQQIGEGGMGVVFMAEQTQPLQRKVALKIIKPGMDSRQVIARFESERQALALMDHPHIAKVLDAGTTDNGRPYFVMELVKGVPIIRYCDDLRLTPRDRLELFVSVCQAVQHAHQKGIIHRDLKPSNVLLAEYDDKPVAKVIDFGVAKATGSKLTERTMFTEFGQIVGTLEYMSPEQAKLNALDIDTRSDIYALGVLLYETLTGTTPFDTKRLHEAAFDEMLRIIREEEPPRPSKRLSTTAELPSIAARRRMEPAKLGRLLEGDLDWIVMKALEKDRARRYETANGLALDVERYLADEPVQARPPSAGYRVRKFVRRNQRSVLAASLVLLALVGGIIGTTIGLVRAEKSRQAEADQRQLAHTNLQKALASAAAEKVAKDSALAREAEARAHRLVWQSLATLPRNPGLALLLAIEGAQRGGRRLAPHNHALQVALDACHEERTWNVHTGDGSVVRFSPDNQRILALGDDGILRILDAATGQVQVQIPGYPKHTRDALWSPDGQRIITLYQNSYMLAYSDRKTKLDRYYTDRVARLWDPQTGKQIAVLRGHKGRVTGAAFSPDGRQLVTICWDLTARLWDAATGKETAVLGGHSYSLLTAAFSADSQRVVTISAGKVYHSSYPSGPDLKSSVDGQPIPDDPRFIDPDEVSPLDFPGVLVGHGTTSGGERSDPNPVTTYPPGNPIFIDPKANPLVVRVWNAATGKEIASLSKLTVFPKDVREIEPVFGGFAGSGQRALVGLRDAERLVHVWDVAAGKRLASLTPVAALPLPPAWQNPFTLSPSGEAVLWVTGSYVRVWNTVTGKEICTLGGQGEPVRAAWFCPRGERVVTLSERSCRIWDLITGVELAVLNGHEQRVHFADLSLDRQRAVTASADGTVRLWRVAPSRAYALVLRGHTGPVQTIRFSPDSMRVLTAADKTARIWDAVTGETLAVLQGALHPDVAQAVARAATRYAEQTDYRNTPFSQEQIARYRAASMEQSRARMENEILGGLSDAQFSPNGRTVMTVSRDSPVVLVKNDSKRGADPTGQELPHVPVRIIEVPTGKSADKYRKLSAGKQLVTFQVEKNPPPNPKHPWAGQRNHVQFAQFSLDGRRLLVVEDNSFSRYTIEGGYWNIGSHDQPTAVRIYEVATGNELIAFRFQGSIRALFSPDGQQVLTASQLIPDVDLVLKKPATGEPIPFRVTAGKSICLRDTSTGKRLTKLDLVNWENPVLSFGSGGPRVLAFRDNRARVWDVAAGKGGTDKQPSLEEISSRLRDGATWNELITIQGPKKFLSAAFSPDGGSLAIVNDDSAVEIWDTDTARQLALLQGHQRKINAIAFSPDSKLVVTASDDETARLWYADTGQELYTLAGHQKAVTFATFSPDGKRVATASADGTGRVWLIDPLSIAIARKPRELTSEERQRYELDPPVNP